MIDSDSDFDVQPGGNSIDTQRRKTIFFGRFVSTPSSEQLLIRTGAVLVSSADGRGVIEKCDWSVSGPSEAVSKLGVEAPVVCAAEEGWFFPGFIGGCQNVRLFS